MITKLKYLAIKIGIKKIQASDQKGKLEFNTDPKINPVTLIKLIQTQSQRYQLQGPSRLCFTLTATQAEEKISEITALLHLLGEA